MTHLPVLRRLLVWVCLLVELGTWAAPPSDLAAHLAELPTARLMTGAHVGIFIQSVSNGDIWYTRDAGESFIPASTAKLVTVALALNRLGASYRFNTQVYADGPIFNGVVEGNLYLRGEGDPSLMPEDLHGMAKALASGDPARGIAPIHAVRGKLYLDTSFFPQPGGPLLGVGWSRDDLPWYYAAPASALSCHGNAVTVTVHGARIGEAPTVVLQPDTSLFSVSNRAVTRVSSPPDLRIIPRGYRVSVTGALSPGEEVIERISVPQPEIFTVELFSNYLRSAGVAIAGIDRGRTDTTLMTLLTTHRSNTLGELLRPLLKKSDNQMAEQLQWTLLARCGKDYPLPERFAGLIAELTHDNILPWGIQQVDGSGLSRLDRLTPAAAVRILVQMMLTPDFDAFYQALPIAGVDGTLEKRLRGTLAAGNAHAKTGSMHGVSTLAGYVATHAGEQLVYAIFINDNLAGSSAAREYQDEIVNYLAGVGDE